MSHLIEREFAELEDMIPELKRRGLIAQVARFAQKSIELHGNRSSCELRLTVKRGKGSTWRKVEVYE